MVIPNATALVINRVYRQKINKNIIQLFMISTWLIRTRDCYVLPANCILLNGKFK